jgi:hypothetical protein
MNKVDHISIKPLLDKLGIKPESAVAVIGIKDESFFRLLNTRTADIYVGRLRKDLDAIFFGADSIRALGKLERLKTYIKPNGAIWVVSLKGKAAHIRDVDVIAAAKRAGLVDHKVVSFSATHTSLRLVIPVSSRNRQG